MKIKTMKNLGIFLMLSLASSSLFAQEKLAYFETHIRPALVKYCYECHSEETGKTQGGLLLDTRGGYAAGRRQRQRTGRRPVHQITFLGSDQLGRFGNAAEEANAGASDPIVPRLGSKWEPLTRGSGKRLWWNPRWTCRRAGSIGRFKAPPPLREQRLIHWSRPNWPPRSLAPVGPTDAPTLLRRLSFDLVGLPPTPEELATFTVAWRRNAKAAITAKVDELLKRLQFGERWGRHWLDVARYAESTGKDVNVTYPHAWRYRDYVFDAFNADKPYDEFIREQIAGDMLPAKTNADWQEHLIATGFLAMGTKGLNERNPRQFQMDSGGRANRCHEPGRAWIDGLMRPLPRPQV